jgi:hypothetical protein
LNRNLETLSPALAALAMAVAFWVLLAFLSHGVDRPPVISQIQVDPPRVPLGGNAAVHFHAADPDGGRLTYECAVDAGACTVPDKNKPEATYVPAEHAAAGDRVTLTLTVTDPGGLTSTGTQPVIIDAAPKAAPPAEAPAEAPTGGNHPLALSGGKDLRVEGDNPVVLEATGGGPEGQDLKFDWEFGSCLLSANAGRTHAEVRLRPGCEAGKAILKWTDAHDATATTEWEIHH